MIKKIAILTSGGDAPGMNNTVRGLVKAAKINNIQAFLVFDGYKGLHENNIKSSDDFDVDNYISNGGTFIGSARFPEFKDLKVREVAKSNLDKRGIEALVVIGGDGSYHGAQLLHELGVKTMALPGTIDNDITSSDFTIGYSTALNTIVENVEKVRDTMKSHNRIAIIEVMGRNCGDLALFSGIATSANIISTSENKLSPKEIGEALKKQINEGKRGLIAIVSELLYDDLNKVAKEVEKITGTVTRGVVLGHVQRGGKPTAEERINATLMSIHAVELLSKGKSGFAVGIINNEVKATPILEALKIPRVNRKSFAQKINKLNQA